MHTTTNLGLDVVDSSDNVSSYPTVNAQAMGVLDTLPLFTTVTDKTVSATLTWGQSVVASPSTTMTLPTITAGVMVAVTALSTVTGATPVTITGAASSIFGLGLNGVTSFTLGSPGAHVVLQSDGTHWYVVGGQQDTGWVALSTMSLNVNLAAAGSITPAARVLGDRVMLRGALNVGVSGLASSATLFTLPAAFRAPNGGQPLIGVNRSSTQGAAILNVVSGGGCSISLTFANNDQILPDGTTWSLT